MADYPWSITSIYKDEQFVIKAYVMVNFITRKMWRVEWKKKNKKQEQIGERLFSNRIHSPPASRLR